MQHDADLDLASCVVSLPVSYVTLSRTLSGQNKTLIRTSSGSSIGSGPAETKTSASGRKQTLSSYFTAHPELTYLNIFSYVIKVKHGLKN